MALPVLNTPKFKLKLPSDSRVVNFRPFLVKEQKVLVIAKEGEDQSRSLDSIKTMLKGVTAFEENDWFKHWEKGRRQGIV